MTTERDAETTTTANAIASLVRRARCVMLEPMCAEKARLTAETRDWWRRVRRNEPCDDAPGEPQTAGGDDLDVVVEDPRREIVVTTEPGKTKRIGKGGTVESRVAILHSLAHIESWAIDLAWDAIQRFGQARAMPVEFYDDFVELAADEGRHFDLLSKRLVEYDSRYGALEAHDGLWQTARETSESLEARLAVEHAVHEARGLDVLPQTIGKFRRNGDEASATLLEEVVYPEEITHCAAGLRWFKFLHARDGDGADARSTTSGENGEETETSSVVQAFHAMVRKHFAGALKPPFNVEARAKAGFTPVWYEPLVEKKREEEEEKDG